MLHKLRLPFSGRFSSLLLFLIALTAMVVRTPWVSAAIIVNDTWQDGTDSDPASPIYSEYGVDSDADGNIESAWFQGGDGTLDPVGAGGPERGKFSAPTSASSASWTTFFTPAATPVLLNQDDKVRITWKFIPANVNATNGSNNLRIAVV